VATLARVDPFLEVTATGDAPQRFGGSEEAASCMRVSGISRIVKQLGSVMAAALVPMMSVAFSGSLRSTSKPGGKAGVMPPSYHTHFTPGRLPRAGNWYVTTEAVGALISVWLALTASTLLGACRSSAQKPPSIMWQPMSPSAPVPKSR
jgi:hypothetical protein